MASRVTQNMMKQGTQMFVEYMDGASRVTQNMIK